MSHVNRFWKGAGGKMSDSIDFNYVSMTAACECMFFRPLPLFSLLPSRQVGEYFFLSLSTLFTVARVGVEGVGIDSCAT